MLFTNLSSYLSTVCLLYNNGVIEMVSIPSQVVMGATEDCRVRGRYSNPSCGSVDVETWCV